MDGEEEEDGQEERDGDGADGLEGDDGEPGAPGDDAAWEEILVCPLTIRFTQEKIHPFFYRRGPIVNVVPRIRVLRPQAADDAVELVPPFGAIQCLRKGAALWSLDNRRLYALQLAAMEQWPRRCRVRVLCRDRLQRYKFKTQYRKFSTTSEGRSIEVCTRYQQLDTWSWFDRAVELEWYEFSQVLGTVMSAFEVAPVLGALLFRTGLTCFTSRVPLVVAFLLAFAADFARQQVPAIDRRICELHVAAVMEGSVRQIFPCGWCARRAPDAPEPSGTSAAQVAAVVGLVLALVLPYVLGVPHAKLRSSLLSFWLGVACVLAAQLFTIARGATASEYTGAERRLTPKHRD